MGASHKPGTRVQNSNTHNNWNQTYIIPILPHITGAPIFQRTQTNIFMTEIIAGHIVMMSRMTIQAKYALILSTCINAKLLDKLQ